jgi:hypothetical protein
MLLEATAEGQLQKGDPELSEEVDTARHKEEAVAAVRPARLALD